MRVPRASGNPAREVMPKSELEDFLMGVSGGGYGTASGSSFPSPDECDAQRMRGSLNEVVSICLEIVMY